MKVLKFGGTSVGSPKSIKEVANIVRNIDGPKTVVLSAMSGTTNALHEVADLIIKNDDENLTNTAKYYEQTVEPFLKKYNYPPLNSENMAKAQQEIVDNWKNEKIIKGEQ